MRVLFVHNAYQHRGGEDAVVEAEIALLRTHGHEVETLTRSNCDVVGMSSAALAFETLWSRRTVRELTEILHRFHPDVIHVHNTFPLISPSLYWAASQARVPVVQTLHNFRLMCLNAMFLRKGKVCEDCIGGLPWRGVVRGCYRKSHLASSALAGMITLHRSLGTFRHKVARYIALNEFCRGKFIAGGLPAERILVKPNFVGWNDSPVCQPVSQEKRRAHFLFVGRLSVEKGIAALANAMEMLPGAQVRVAGDGPEGALLEGKTGLIRLGVLKGEAIRGEMDCAIALLMPSIWYENFPRTLVEAFSCSLPVIASRIGALAELVDEGRTGLLFEPGDPHDLAAKMDWALAHPAEMRQMGEAARREYEEKYSPERNYEMLMDIYRGAIDEANGNG